MSMNTVVHSETYSADCRSAWKEFLRSFFPETGTQTHLFGDLTVVFPCAGLAFNRTQVVKMTKPLITVSPMPNSRHKETLKDRGMVEAIHQNWQILVRTASAGNDWTANDQMQDRLGLILNGSRPLMAESGLRILNVGLPVQLQEDGIEYQISQRLLTTLVYLDINLAGTGANYVESSGGVN